MIMMLTPKGLFQHEAAATGTTKLEFIRRCFCMYDSCLLSRCFSHAATHAVNLTLITEQSVESVGTLCQVTKGTQIGQANDTNFRVGQVECPVGLVEKIQQRWIKTNNVPLSALTTTREPTLSNLHYLLSTFILFIISLYPDQWWLVHNVHWFIEPPNN